MVVLKTLQIVMVPIKLTQYKMMQMHMPNVVGEMNVHQLKTLHRLQIVSCNNRQQSA